VGAFVTVLVDVSQRPELLIFVLDDQLQPPQFVVGFLNVFLYLTEAGLHHLLHELLEHILHALIVLAGDVLEPFLQSLQGEGFLLLLLQLLLEHLDLVALLPYRRVHLVCALALVRVLSLVAGIHLRVAHCRIRRKLHRHLERKRLLRKLADLVVLAWGLLDASLRGSTVDVVGRAAGLFLKRVSALTAFAAGFGVLPLHLLCFAVLHALVVGLVGIFPDVGGLSDDWLGHVEVALALVGGYALVFHLCLGHGLLVVDDGRVVDEALHRRGLLLEVVALVDVLDYAFVLVLHVLNLFLEVLELHVEGLDLLHPTAAAVLVHGLGDRGVRGVQLGAHASASFLHPIIFTKHRFIYEAPIHLRST
jgi:hypothetical protein